MAAQIGQFSRLYDEAAGLQGRRLGRVAEAVMVVEAGADVGSGRESTRIDQVRSGAGIVDLSRVPRGRRDEDLKGGGPRSSQWSWSYGLVEPTRGEPVAQLSGEGSDQRTSLQTPWIS